MNKPSVKVNQVWRNKKVPEFRLLISGSKGGKWKTKVLSGKPGVYRGSHLLPDEVLWFKYELESK